MRITGALLFLRGGTAWELLHLNSIGASTVSHRASSCCLKIAGILLSSESTTLPDFLRENLIGIIILAIELTEFGNGNLYCPFLTGE